MRSKELKALGEAIMQGIADGITGANIDREELAAVPGQVVCTEVHGRGGSFPHEVMMIPAFEHACSGCGAAL